MIKTVAEPATFDALLSHGKKTLINSPAGTPGLDAEVILAHVLGIDRMKMLADPPVEISKDSTNRYTAYMERRFGGEPVAYITGEKYFYNSVFKVSPAVLIPRPETEIMVDEILNSLAGSSALSVCDIGTGSGCIALSLARERPSWNITATDISAEALEIAKENARNLGVNNVRFIQKNLFEEIAEKFDLITCNPPYVDEREKEKLQVEIVGHEPHGALFADDGGLGIIKKFVNDAPQFLKDGGRLYCEIGYDQKNTVEELFKNPTCKKPLWQDVTFIRDLAGHYRHVAASIC